MTWTKLGDEFSDDCANADLTDAAYRTHDEAIAFVYRIERMDLRFGKRMVRRFAGSDQYEDGIALLLGLGWWRDHGDEYEIQHHADVIRASIAAQQSKRARDRRAQRQYRAKQGGAADGDTRASADVSADVSADASAAVSGDADRQTDMQTATTETETHARESQWPEVAPLPDASAAAGGEVAPAEFCRWCGEELGDYYAQVLGRSTHPWCGL